MVMFTTNRTAFDQLREADNQRVAGVVVVVGVVFVLALALALALVLVGVVVVVVVNGHPHLHGPHRPSHRIRRPY